MSPRLSAELRDRDDRRELARIRISQAGDREVWIAFERVGRDIALDLRVFIFAGGGWRGTGGGFFLPLDKVPELLAAVQAAVAVLRAEAEGRS